MRLPLTLFRGFREHAENPQYSVSVFILLDLNTKFKYYLRKSKIVAHFETGSLSEGGTGTTIVYFK